MPGPPNNIPSSTFYQYPLTLQELREAGQHYLLINSFESKNAITTTGKKISTIALYIPPNSLQTSHSSNYEGLDRGALFAAAGGAAQNVAEAGGSTSSIVAAVVGGAGASRAGALVAGIRAASRVPGVGGDAPGALSASFGVAVNNHMALVYRGPNTFRSHTFNFSFFPKSNTESNVVKSIINDFRNGMLPRYSGAAQNGRLSSPFFKMPRHYQMTIMNNGNINSFLDHELFPLNKKGNKINHVITGMNVNFDPNGVVSFHDDGSPVQTNLSITFQETEFVTSNDEVDDNFEQNLPHNISRQAQAADFERRVEQSGIRQTSGAFLERRFGGRI